MENYLDKVSEGTDFSFKIDVERNGKIALYKRIIDDLMPELRTYRAVLQIINNVLEED